MKMNPTVFKYKNIKKKISYLKNEFIVEYSATLNGFNI